MWFFNLLWMVIIMLWVRSILFWIFNLFVWVFDVINGSCWICDGSR